MECFSGGDKAFETTVDKNNMRLKLKHKREFSNVLFKK